MAGKADEGFSLLELVLTLAIASIVLVLLCRVYVLSVCDLKQIATRHQMIQQGATLHAWFKRLLSSGVLVSVKAGELDTQISVFHYPAKLPKPYQWSRRVLKQHRVNTPVLAIVKIMPTHQTISYLYIANTHRHYRDGSIVPALYLSHAGHVAEEYFSRVENMTIDINQPVKSAIWHNRQILLECLLKHEVAVSRDTGQYYFKGQWYQGAPGFIYQDWPIYILYSAGQSHAKA